MIRRRATSRLGGIVFAAGAVGMLLETALILHYQVTRGAVYQDIGVLLACFMAGLAAGAWAADRPRGTGQPSRQWGWGIGAAMVLLSLAMAWAINSAPGAGLVGIGAELAAAGAAVGAAFAYAALRWPGDPGRGLGALYAMDLVGGCVGAVAATLLIVPLGGLDVTAMAAAVAGAVLCLLV